MKSEQPLFTLGPNLSIAIIPTILSSLLASIFIGFWLVGMIWILSRSLMIGVVISILLFVTIIFFCFMNLNSRRYVFFHDKAEFYEGFLSIVQRTVQYEKVTDCVLNRTVWDRLFGTGTISFMTAGHVGQN